MNVVLTILYAVVAAVLVVAASLIVDTAWADDLSGRETVAIVIASVGVGLTGAALRHLVVGE